MHAQMGIVSAVLVSVGAGQATGMTVRDRRGVGASPAQVIRMAPRTTGNIPKSTHRERLAANADVFGITPSTIRRWRR